MKGLLAMFVMGGLFIDACISFDTYCEEKTDCEEGNDADRDACVVAEEAAADRASLYGCTDEFETLHECREADSECENNIYGLQGDDCSDESQEFSSCMGDNLPPAPF